MNQKICLRCNFRMLTRKDPDRCPLCNTKTTNAQALEVAAHPNDITLKQTETQ